MAGPSPRVGGGFHHSAFLFHHSTNTGFRSYVDRRILKVFAGMLFSPGGNGVFVSRCRGDGLTRHWAGPMIIACDGRALLGPRTGVGTWTVHVMGGLAETPGWTVEVYAHTEPTLPDENLSADLVPVRPPAFRLPGSLWLQWSLPSELKNHGCDLFVGTLAVVPRRCPIPSIVAVHDLTPRLCPDRHTLKNRFCFNAYLEDSLEVASLIVTPTEAIREELLGVFPRVEGRVRVIGDGADHRFRPEGETGEEIRIRKQYAGGKRYILHLGTLEPRKGLSDLIEAWEILALERDGTPDLVLAGGAGWGVDALSRRIRRSPLRQRIHLPGYVPQADVPALLRAAEVFVLASEAEGFGLPLAEALCCGTPSVHSDIPVFHEVARGAALTAPVHAPGALAEVIARALEPEEARRLRLRAVERAADLRWAPTVEKWKTLVEEVMSG